MSYSFIHFLRLFLIHSAGDFQNHLNPQNFNHRNFQINLRRYLHHKYYHQDRIIYIIIIKLTEIINSFPKSVLPKLSNSIFYFLEIVLNC